MQWAVRRSDSNEEGGGGGLELDLQFQLGPGSFATMLLWELLRNEPTAFCPQAGAASAAAVGEEDEEGADE